MKKTIFTVFLLSLTFYSATYAQEAEEKSLMQKLIEENNIPKFEYEKFWTLLERNHITYNPNEKWLVISDSLAYVCNDEESVLRKKFGMRDGILSHEDGECMVAIRVAFKPLDKKKIEVPRGEERAYEEVLTNLISHFEWGKKRRSPSKQDIKDMEMLVTRYPADSARTIFNGISMFIYPLSFKGEYCNDKYRYGRAVTTVSKYNVPLYLFFFLTDESIVDFDHYLSELKGVFWFDEVENM